VASGDLSDKRATKRSNTGSLGTVPRVVVDVVPKPEILDPQGQAIVRALPRMGLRGVRDVRQGKHFELDVDDDVDAETLHRIAGELLANPVIENWTVRRL
jgi:phosphoribosylformylglycinamidine synthase